MGQAFQVSLFDERGGPGLLRRRDAVVESNILAEANFGRLSKMSLKLFLMALLKVRSRKMLDDVSKQVFVSVDEYAERVGRKSNYSLYGVLKQSVEELFRFYVEIRKGRKVERVRLLEKCYFNGGGVGVVFASSIFPYISGLVSHFVMYDGAHVFPMKSIYSIKFYRVLCARNKCESFFSLDEFRACLGLSGRYLDWRNLKRKVVDRIVSDVNTFTNLSLSYELVKRGYAVYGLKFVLVSKCRSEFFDRIADGRNVKV